MDEIRKKFEGKRIAILGFGREGRSTYGLFRSIFPEKILTIIDENDAVRNDNLVKIDPNLNFITGKNCLQALNGFEIVVKSPGIPSNRLPSEVQNVHITSQTDIFLQQVGKQVIGITGTKGKSTTSSLVYHILKTAGRNILLVGNIGIPPFNIINEISTDTIIVMELSSHQLEFVTHSPHIAILLNLFQEHLDHYHSYEDYKLAKLNIAKFQYANDYFIYNNDNEALHDLVLKSGFMQKLLQFSLEASSESAIRRHNDTFILEADNVISPIYDASMGQLLEGSHNIYNIMAAAAACFLAGATLNQINNGVRSFKGLEHRIERVGDYDGITWYNDSIATIPEATIEAMKTLHNVDTLILGGFDRGIDYGVLYPFLINSSLSNIIFVGAAGKRMMDEFARNKPGNILFHKAVDYKEVVDIAREITKKGKICLLSPAAASYDMFKNFEERGDIYKKNVRDLGPSHS